MSRVRFRFGTKGRGTSTQALAEECIRRISGLNTSPTPQLGIMLKTFMREHALLSCLASIFSFPPDCGFRIYIADDGPSDPNGPDALQAKVYDALRTAGHVVRRFPYQTPVTKCRNAILAEMSEPYILRLDDDFEFLPETDIRAMMDVLQKRPELGCIAGLERQLGLGKGVFSGQLSPFQGYLRREGTILIKSVARPSSFAFEEVAGIPLRICDFTRNFLLCRKEIFDDVQWEERLHFQGEHVDFFLQLQASAWKVGFTTASTHAHNERRHRPPGSRKEPPKRELIQDMDWRAVLREKWGITGIRIEAPWLVQVQRAFVSVARRLIISR